jgi:protein gp37
MITGQATTPLQLGNIANEALRTSKRDFKDKRSSAPRSKQRCSSNIEESDPWRDEAFAIMALTPQHTYQVLTKRPDRMLEYLMAPKAMNRIAFKMGTITGTRQFQHLFEMGFSLSNQMAIGGRWPLPNVWLGVSVEDQKTADERIPILLDTPAKLRWLSVEPLLGPLDLSHYLHTRFLHGGPYHEHNRADWVVVGGESGPEARPMHPRWVQILREQCTAAGVPFFFKQWGEYVPDSGVGARTIDFTGKFQPLFPSAEDGHIEPRAAVRKVGKKAAGRALDGRTWDEMPETI